MVRDEPESGSEWEDMTSEDEEVDPMSLDLEGIQNQMEIAKQQAVNEDPSRKLAISISTIEICLCSG